MTITTTTTSASYSGDASTVSFAVPFAFYTSAELHVWTLVSGAGTLKVLGIDYTVTGGGGYTGAITMTTAPAVGTTVLIKRATNRTQSTAWGEGSPFPAAAVEAAYDRGAVVDQELAEMASRAITAPEYEGGLTALPARLTRANRMLVFDSSGQPSVADIPGAGTSLTGNASLATVATAGGTARTLLERFGEKFNVRDYGAVGDNATDATTAIQAAATAAAVNGGVVEVPAGIYKISAAIAVPTNGRVLFRGHGMSSSIIRQTGAGADGITFTNDNFLTSGAGVMDLTIEAGTGLLTASYFGAGSTGTALKVTRGNDGFVSSNIGLHGFARGLALYGCWYTRHIGLRIMCSTTDAVLVAKSGTTVGGGNTVAVAKLSNNGFTGTNTGSTGIHVTASGGDFFQTIDATSFQNGVVMDPTTGDQVLYAFFSQVLADTSNSDGWYINGALGHVYSVVCNNCWSSYNTGNGLSVTGANVRDIQWNGCRSRENIGPGIYMATGGLVVNGGSVVHNSRTVDNVQPGVKVLAGVSDWALVGVRIGNDGQSAAVQAEGVVIDAGASDRFRIIGCDLSNAGAGKSPIANGASGGGAIVAHNLPRALAGVNPDSALVYSGGTAGTVAAASTVYLGPNGAQATEANSVWRAIRAGAITRMSIGVVAAPGAAQTFTYTLRLNGADTAVTGTITGAGSFSATISTPAVTIAALDTLGIKLVTTAGAAATTHAYALRLE